MSKNDKVQKRMPLANFSLPSKPFSINTQVAEGTKFQRQKQSVNRYESFNPLKEHII